jgi:hypothetical protein
MIEKISWMLRKVVDEEQRVLKLAQDHVHCRAVA